MMSSNIIQESPIPWTGILWKRKWFILLVTLIAVITAAVYSLRKPNVYLASSSLVVFPDESVDQTGPAVFSVHTYQKLSKAPDLLQSVIDTLGLTITFYNLNRKK